MLSITKKTVLNFLTIREKDRILFVRHFLGIKISRLKRYTSQIFSKDTLIGISLLFSRHQQQKLKKVPYLSLGKQKWVTQTPVPRFPNRLKPDVFGRPKNWNRGYRDRSWMYQSGVLRIEDGFCNSRGNVFDHQRRLCIDAFHHRRQEFQHLLGLKLHGLKVSADFFEDSRIPKFNKVIKLCQSNDILYGHFLIEVLPRLALCQTSFRISDDFKFYLLNQEPQVLQILKYCGVNTDNILHAQQYPLISAKEIYVPVYHFGRQSQFPDFAVNALSIFKKNIVGSPGQQDLKVYVSRENMKNKRVDDEELIEALKSKGFMILNPEEYSFAEQVEIFDRASVVSGPHGSGMFNIVFCRPNTKVIDLFPAANNTNLYRIAHAFNLDYKVVKVNAGNPVKWSQNCHFKVNTQLSLSTILA